MSRKNFTETQNKENKKSKSKYDLIKEIPTLYIDRPYLKEIDSMSLRCTIFDLDNSYNKFFKEKKGFPKYKSRFRKTHVFILTSLIN